jgi:hypothetical protein
MGVFTICWLRPTDFYLKPRDKVSPESKYGFLIKESLEEEEQPSSRNLKDLQIP